jgi:hypothetical protein
MSGEWSLAEVSAAISASWGPETTYATDGPSRKPGDRSRGQCGTTALVVHDWLGGDILSATVSRDGQAVGVHYWNRLPGNVEVDLTRGQFLPNEAIGELREVIRPQSLEGLPGYDAYIALSDRVRALLGP